MSRFTGVKCDLVCLRRESVVSRYTGFKCGRLSAVSRFTGVKCDLILILILIICNHIIITCVTSSRGGMDAVAECVAVGWRPSSSGSMDAFAGCAAVGCRPSSALA